MAIIPPIQKDYGNEHRLHNISTDDDAGYVEKEQEKTQTNNLSSQPQ